MSCLLSLLQLTISSGGGHETRRGDGSVDPWHVSGRVWTESRKPLTSFHLYPNGFVKYSRAKYADVQVPAEILNNAGASSGAAAAQPTQPAQQATQSTQATAPNL